MEPRFMEKREVIVDQSFRGYDNPGLARQIYDSYLELGFIPRELIDLRLVLNCTAKGLDEGLKAVLKEYAIREIFGGCSLDSVCTSKKIFTDDEESHGSFSNARRIVEERVQ